MSINSKNVMIFGAKGDGSADDTAALQKALDGTGEVFIPKGRFSITKTLLVGSDTKITADKDAVIFAHGEVTRGRGDFLLSNRNPEKGDRNIAIHGGVWDGNNQGRLNKKGNLFDQNGWSGTTLNFRHVDGLKITGITVANSVAFNFRMCGVQNFHFEDIIFASEVLTPNQDGFHFGGFCKNGIVKNVTCTNGSTNDDLIALNADDCIERVDAERPYRKHYF